MNRLRRGEKTYFLKIEEDGIEAKEHESNTSGEPAPGFVAESFHVNPCSDIAPCLWCMMLVGWVWSAEDEREDACHRSESCNITDSIVETNSVDEVTKHGGVDYTSYASTTGNIAYGESSAFGEPCGSNWRQVSGNSDVTQCILLTLRARYKESCHAEANNEALSDPDSAKVCHGFDVTRVYDTKHEETKRYEERAAANHLAEVPGIQ